MIDHVIVTGAGTGIGRAIALRLASSNVNLSLMARSLPRLEDVATQCREAGARAVALTCDIRDDAAVADAFGQAVAAHGPITGLVANAGVGGANTAGEGDRFFDLVNTNLTGTYRCCRAAEGPKLRDVVIVASILARIGVPGYTGYCASKAGLLGLTRALAAEWASKGVHVNAVCPGWVDTAMAHEGLQGMADGMGITKDEAYKMAMSEVPLGRMSQPEHIASMVAWLLSADAQGITGQGLDINGGAFMQ